MNQMNLIPASISDNIPAMVRNEIVTLSPQKQEEFVEEFKRKSKSLGASYLLWFFLGWHYAYQNKWGMQFLYWCTFAGMMIWGIVDAFRMPAMIRDYNKDVAVDVLRNLKVISSST